MNRKSIPVFLCVLTFVFCCTNVPDNVAVISQSSCELEYLDFIKSVERNKNEIRAIEADILPDFLDRFSALYSSFYRDKSLADWYETLGIGDSEHLSAAGDNMGRLVGANTGTFRRLRGEYIVKNGPKDRSLSLWDRVFETDKKGAGKRGSGEIYREVREIEDKILKNDSRDFHVLVDQETLFSRLFKLRNEVARNRGCVYMFFPDYKIYPDEYVEYISGLVHETGHAIHFQYMDAGSVILNFFDNTVTETVAILFENMIYTREWLAKNFAGVLSEKDIGTILMNRKKSMIEFFRYALFLWMFEKSVYTNPDQNMEDLYSSLSHELGMPKTMQCRLWYDTGIFASHDLYYVHYTLAYVCAFKLGKLLEKKFGKAFFENPETGRFLIENIFKYGRALEPKELFKRLFGDEELGIKEYFSMLLSTTL
jgi:hypothetical protein